MSNYPENPVIHTMHNANNLSVTVMDWGATMLDISLKLKGSNETRHLLIRPRSVADYKNQDLYLNATIGRYANRLRNSAFSIDGKDYKLQSNALHCLHGGIEGFDKRRFTFIDKTDNSCTLELLSPDGDQGFPGNFTLTVIFTLQDDDTMQIEYKGSCDSKTYASITNHAYFNLNGTNSSVLDHSLYLRSDEFLELDDNSVPTGKILKIDNESAFDFRTKKKISKDFLNHSQMIKAKGYDHPYLIDGDISKAFAELTSEDGKVSMKVYTNYKCCQFYSGNYINASSSVIDKNGKIYANQSALCLEPGFCPDGPNMEHLKAPVIDKDNGLDYTIVYKFDSI